MDFKSEEAYSSNFVSRTKNNLYTKNTLIFSNVIRVKAERKEGAMIAELYTVYRAELLRYCCMICGNSGDAEVLLQETFLKALSNLELLEELGEKERRA